jgi:hypothetical protein
MSKDNAPSIGDVLAGIRKEFGAPAFRRTSTDAPEPPPLPDPEVAAASQKLAQSPPAGEDPGGPLT